MDEGICFTCLSRGRVLYPLQHVGAAYTTLIAGLQSHEQTEHVRTFGLICWECLGFLKKMLRFQTQVIHASVMLQSYADNMSNMTYSTLGMSSKIGFDLEIQYDGLEFQWESVMAEDIQTYDIKLENSFMSEERSMDGKEKETIKTEVVIAGVADENVAAKPKPKRRSSRKKEHREEKIARLTLSEHDMERYRGEEREKESYVKAPYKCESCIKGFIFAVMLEKHNSAKHNPALPYECNICKWKFSSGEVMSRHRDKHYALYRCGECDFSARGRGDAERHRAAHGPAQLFPCGECAVVALTKRKLRYHMESAHKEAVRCTVCDKVMINRYSLKHHMLTHTGMPTFECGICRKVYRGEAGLYSHMRHFHSDDPSETYCKQCDIHFKNKTIYRSHLKRSEKHATSDQLKFVCEKCPKRFISEASLRKHHRYYHLDYVCHLCQKRLKNWFSLDNHIKFVHEGREMPRKHMCETCGKGFKTKTMLNNHQTTHTGARPHGCHLCGAAFSVKSALRTHTRHVHAGRTDSRD